MLKTYEDELYKPIKTRYPNKTLNRVNTSKFNSIIETRQEKSGACDENEVVLLRQFKINEQITEAMDILDQLSASQNSKARMDTGETEAINRYEKWQLKWNQMLNFMF